MCKRTDRKKSSHSQRLALKQVSDICLLHQNNDGEVIYVIEMERHELVIGLLHLAFRMIIITHSTTLTSKTSYDCMYKALHSEGLTRSFSYMEQNNMHNPCCVCLSAVFIQINGLLCIQKYGNAVWSMSQQKKKSLLDFWIFFLHFSIIIIRLHLFHSHCHLAIFLLSYLQSVFIVAIHFNFCCIFLKATGAFTCPDLWMIRQLYQQGHQRHSKDLWRLTFIFKLSFHVWFQCLMGFQA